MTGSNYTTNEYGEYIKHTVPCGASLSGITDIKVQYDINNMNFIGIGVAITGSSCYNLSLMEKEERLKLLKFLYTEEGLNLKIGRLTVGSSDYSAEIYTYNDGKEDLSLSRFSIDRDKEYIIPIIKEILDINPSLTLFASPWSPPNWMKTGNSIGGGYMREKYLECYADYFVKYIKAYAAEGIKIKAITPQNEVNTQQNGKMPACIWHPDTEAKFVGILRKKFDEHGIATEIWCFDHNFSDINRVNWCLSEYPTLKNECNGLAFHYYSGSIEQTTCLKEKYPHLKLHFTEGGPRLYDNYDTDWCKWALMIIRTLCNHYSSFTGWNLMLDETGGPNVGPFFCGGLVTRNYLNGTLSYSGQYKAFRHFAGLKSSSVICPLVFHRPTKKMAGYPDSNNINYTEGCFIQNQDEDILILTNPCKQKEQLQFFYKDQYWYIEMMPNTVSTIIFKK